MHQAIDAARIGVYACSPLQSSVEVEFSDFRLGPCVWVAHTS
jgi:regulation of enolase protein 1 (concanavalin A-like superfamily)